MQNLFRALVPSFALVLAVLPADAQPQGEPSASQRASDASAAPPGRDATSATVTKPGPRDHDGADRPATPARGFLYKTIELEERTYPYCVFVPPDYTPKRAWPVILFLHGSGERGTDGLLQTDVGIGRALRRHAARIPALVVMPQCPPDQTWLGPMANVALACVEQTFREYHGDPRRVYLTGLSLGGQGVWHIAAALPDRFAAIVPICGFAELGEDTGVADKVAARLTDMPIWAFHGADDRNVPAEKTRRMINAVRAARGAAGGEVFYTEYPTGGHTIWNRAYDDAKLWRWLFAQRRGGAEE